jgi:hypothetical protein
MLVVAIYIKHCQIALTKMLQGFPYNLDVIGNIASHNTQRTGNLACPVKRVCGGQVKVRN